ncbi:hypothetical protein CYMTET_12404 [Cymbomonas tetramitiformis]|uniref:Uncharacterized protein n=1 Tax=Cymbomonas tetramitiformis TaxID=36881 RepID=A0AAE0GKE1_9CHLO|nr:hypothetical protein CYMTET_12404 [Cymbomonas tetramitiformis]
MEEDVEVEVVVDEDEDKDDDEEEDAALGGPMGWKERWLRQLSFALAPLHGGLVAGTTFIRRCQGRCQRDAAWPLPMTRLALPGSELIAWKERRCGREDAPGAPSQSSQRFLDGLENLSRGGEEPFCSFTLHAEGKFLAQTCMQACVGSQAASTQNLSVDAKSGGG